MNKEFSIQDWKYDQLIKEERNFHSIGMKELESIYHFLMLKLDSPAKEAGLRMSIFEQEFPTVSSFTMEYDRGADKPVLPSRDIDENINSNVESIEITHNEQNGMIYKIQVWVGGKETRPSEEELNDIISSAIGEEVKIPNRYNPEEFQHIEDKLLAQDIKVDYNDLMDVS